MQTNPLPILAGTPGVQTQGLRQNAALPNDGANFGAALARQLDQRQIEQRQLEQRQAQPQAQAQPQPQPNMAAPAAVAGPKPQAAAKPAANEAKAPAREAARETAKEAAKDTASAEGTDKAEAATAAAGETKTAVADDSAAAAASSLVARAADSVADMLAQLAGLNQVQPAPAAALPVPAATEPVATQPGILLEAMKAAPGDGAEPLLTPAVKPEGGAMLATLPEQPQAKAEPGIDLRALELVNTAEQAKLPANGGEFAAALRENVAQAALREAAPTVETLGSLAAQATALQTAQASGSVPTDRLSARVGTPAWDNQVGQKVIWMVGGEDQSATLELNPPDLGPVQVVLNVSNDLASVTFSSQQLEVRQALENALPRLREMMSESGIALGNATVNAGAEGRQGQDGQNPGGPGRGKGGRGDNGGDSAVAEAAPRQRTGVLGGAGAVDTFA